MAKEIEHKFLVKKKLLPNFKKLKPGHVKVPVIIPFAGRNLNSFRLLMYMGKRNIVQGYLSRSPVVRIRIFNKTEAFMTVKGKGCRVRDEFEFPIPYKSAVKMLKLCGERKIKKVRHYLGPWEIDFFKGKHKGLILAEIELPNKTAKLPRLPDWIGKEVTYDPKYSNASLSEK